MEVSESTANRLVYDVPEAGALAGLGRNASYKAVQLGHMPSVKIGGRIFVPKALWDAILRGDVAQK